MKKDTEFYEPLRAAVFSCDIDRIKAITATLSSVDITSERGESILGLVAACGYTEIANVLLDAGASIDGVDLDDLAYTPLIRATREGKTEMVKFLVGKGASLEAGDSRAGTPVLHACITARQDILQYLLAAGANINTVDNRGQTPVHFLCQHAIQWGSWVVTETKNDGTTREAPTGRFAQHTEVLTTLIRAGADLEKETSYGYTALHWAANTNTHQFVRLLIDAGANIHHANANGYTPLHAGADTGAFQSCARLLDFGADKNAIDKYGFTPLIGAVLGGHERVVQLLLDYGADRNHQVTSSYDKVVPGDTALDVAVKLKKENIVALLRTA